jgi:hypothetical protein
MLGAALTGLTEHSSPPSAPSASSDPRPQPALLPSRPFQSRDRKGAVLPEEPRPHGAVPPSASSEPQPQAAVLPDDPRSRTAASAPLVTNS